MPDLLTEDVLGTGAAARYLNERVPDGRFTPMGTWRCMTKGTLSRNGERIYLEHIKLGRKLYTSKQGLARYASRLACQAPAELGPFFHPIYALTPRALTWNGMASFNNAAGLCAGMRDRILAIGVLNRCVVSRSLGAGANERPSRTSKGARRESVK